MTDLFEKSIRTLELPAVLEKLAAKAVSDAAKERCLRLTPATDTQEVLHLLDETDAAKERLGLHGSPSFSGVKDVSAALTRADHGGMLNTRELLDVAGRTDRQPPGQRIRRPAAGGGHGAGPAVLLSAHQPLSGG